MSATTVGSVVSPSYKFALAGGLFLVVTTVYILSAHGRIDSVDGQFRFDAACSFVDIGLPILRDPSIFFAGRPGRGGLLYGPCSPGRTLVSTPLIALGKATGDPTGQRRMFLFSLTGCFVGGALAAVLLLFLLELGTERRAAVGWTLMAAFATLLWPAAATVLDQGQQAFWALLAVYLAVLAGRRDSSVLAASGGLAAGVMVLYQSPYLLHMFFLAIAATTGARGRSSPRGRYLVFVAAGLLGAAALISFNLYTYGSPIRSAPAGASHPPLFGNPLSGVAGLLFSPGKSILVYCPTIVLGILGWRTLSRREPHLGRTILWVSLFHLLFIGSLSIWHGDWCWGPRYLTVLVPLWCLAFPFAKVRKPLIAALVAAGVLVNVLGLSLIHERFFYDRALPTYFWWWDGDFYWRNSALIARIKEIADVAAEGVPPEAKAFAPTPYRGLLTYFVDPGALTRPSISFMRQYGVFWLPRPWLLWMPAVEARGWAPHGLPIPWRTTAVSLLLIGIAGGLLIRVGLRTAPARVTVLGDEGAE